MALHLQIIFSTIRNDELVKSLLLSDFEISTKPAPTKTGGGNPFILVDYGLLPKKMKMIRNQYPGIAACFGIPHYLSKTFYKTFPVFIVLKYFTPLYSSYYDIM